MNRRIRASITQYVNTNGPTDSRQLIALMAQRFSVPKQKISGNLSYMICKAGTLSLISNRPHSIVY